jgi:uncharacterized protein YfdQ (DUF2303 family)
MSAELLRRAATKLEELAADTTRGPWDVEHDYSGVVADSDYGGTVSIGGFDRPGDNEWAATMGPQIAAPLAAWLRAEATRFENEGWDGAEPDWAPLVFARALLGEELQ